MIAAAYPTAAIRVTSTWIDSKPQAYPKASAFNCELGDLLVVVRIQDAAVGTRRRVGWIVQAKKARLPGIFKRTDPSTLKEIALYEEVRNWKFEVRRSSTSVLGSFDLRADRDIARATTSVILTDHWHFLLFCESVPSWGGAWVPISPIQWAWPASVTLRGGGLSDALLSMVSFASGPGIELCPDNQEWTNLCTMLIRITRTKASKLPGGRWQHTIMSYGWATSKAQAEQLLASLSDAEPPAQDVPELGGAGDEGGIGLLEIDVAMSHEGEEARGL